MTRNPPTCLPLDNCALSQPIQKNDCAFRDDAHSVSVDVSTYGLGRFTYNRSSTGIQTHVMTTIATSRKPVTTSRVKRATIDTAIRRIESRVAYLQTSDAVVI